MTKEQQILDAALDACEAALRYDRSIYGRAARGEELTKSDVTGEMYAEGEDLDTLYIDWQQKAKHALKLAGRPSVLHD